MRAELPIGSAPYTLHDVSVTVKFAFLRLEELARFPLLNSALGTSSPEDGDREPRDVVTVAYHWIARYWRGLRIIERTLYPVVV
jgi:hypothetical protein